MKKTNGEGIINTGKGEFRKVAVLLGIGFLALFLVGGLIAGVPNVSATNTTTAFNKSVDITAITIVNDSGVLKLTRIQVENDVFNCTDNHCEVLVEYECVCENAPECPEINFTELVGNFTTKMDDLEALVKSHNFTELEGNITTKMGDLETLVKSHNSSNLEEEDRTYIDTTVSEGASYSAAQIWELLNQTLMPSRRELEDKDDAIGSLKNSLSEMNNTINLQGEEIKNYEKREEERTLQNRLLVGMLIIVMIAVLLYVFLDIGESVREGRVVLKGREGWTSGEKEIKMLEEENERKTAELKKQRLAERSAELDSEFAQHSPSKDTAQPLGGVGVNSQAQVQAQDQPQNPGGLEFSDVDGTALIANYILARDGYAHTRGDIEQYLAGEGYMVDVERVKRLSTNARRMVESLKRGKFVDGEQGRKPWSWIKWEKK